MFICSSHHCPGLVTTDSRAPPKPVFQNWDSLAKFLIWSYCSSGMSLGPWCPLLLYHALRPGTRGHQGHSLCYTPSLAPLDLEDPLNLKLGFQYFQTWHPWRLHAPIPGHARSMEGTSGIWSASHSRPCTGYPRSTGQTISHSSPLRPLGSPPTSTPRLRRRGSSPRSQRAPDASIPTASDSFITP